MHVCAHTDEDKEACFNCKRPMTKYAVSTFNGFNKFINSISHITFLNLKSDLVPMFLNIIEPRILH